MSDITTAPAPAPAKPRRKRRVFLWIFLAVQVLFLAWLISGVAASGSGIHADVAAKCVYQAAHMGMTKAQCISWLGGAAKTGTAIGAALIVVAWVVVDFLMATTYLIYRVATRHSRQAS